MDPLTDISEKLRSIMTSVKDQTKRRVQGLQEHKRKIQDKANNEAERVATLFKDIKAKLEDLEKDVLKEIFRQNEQLSSSISNQIEQLEMKNDELSKKISDPEEQRKMKDPSTAFQEWKVDEILGDDGQAGDLDEGHITVILQRGLADIMTTAQRQLYTAELTLDVRTAAQDVAMLDFKTAQTAELDQHRLETPMRFKKSQVISEESFSSGRHYWEMELSTCGVWYVGVSYASVEKEGLKSFLGNNDKSWCVCLFYKDYTALHDSQVIELPVESSSLKLLGIYLDYEAGKLSFYELGNPIKHLHTFTATFTEPLHAAFSVCRNSWVKIRN